MAYDDKLAERLSALIKKKRGFSEKKMFGGIAYMLNGNMCFGVHKDSLVIRTDEESANKALEEKNVRVFDITGRPMKGWVMVSKEGLKTKQNLEKWTALAVNFVKTLPKK